VVHAQDREREEKNLRQWSLFFLPLCLCRMVEDLFLRRLVTDESALEPLQTSAQLSTCGTCTVK